MTSGRPQHVVGPQFEVVGHRPEPRRMPFGQLVTMERDRMTTGQSIDSLRRFAPCVLRRFRPIGQVISRRKSIASANRYARSVDSSSPTSYA
jgi:hypothetical protein